VFRFRLLVSFGKKRNVLLWTFFFKSTGGEYNGQGRSQHKLMACAQWEFLAEAKKLQIAIPPPLFVGEKEHGGVQIAIPPKRTKTIRIKRHYLESV
jgi:hypothetical protein